MDEGQDRFTVNLQKGKTGEETAARCFEEVISLVQQLNAASIPISVGPGQSLPEGMRPGQIVNDWRSGATVVKTWNGNALV
jgi:hypothetical protein